MSTSSPTSSQVSLALSALPKLTETSDARLKETANNVIATALKTPGWTGASEGTTAFAGADNLDELRNELEKSATLLIQADQAMEPLLAALEALVTDRVQGSSIPPSIRSYIYAALKASMRVGTPEWSDPALESELATLMGAGD